ncbi:MAG: phosphoketolase family protein, partial [Candidatus Sulfotelmatobacter sp.]
HLNGYKIDNPTLLARISHDELENLFRGYGWTPYFVEGSDIDSMHQAMAATVERCVDEIREHRKTARENGSITRPRWPMIVLRSPKGWTAPRQMEGHYLEGFWRAHQVPLPAAKRDPEQLRILETWMRSQMPQSFFDGNGKLASVFRELAPTGDHRMSANPHANGGRLKKALRLPDFREFAAKVDKPGTTMTENTRPLGFFLAETMKRNSANFRVFGPDETSSNKLDGLYTVTKKFWIEDYFPEDADGGNLAVDGRVLEMLSEHTMEGMLEGYLLTGRHGFLSSYESFIHIIDSMFNQHAKWLEISSHLSWRQAIASLNLLITSTVWRQDHNGFTHQDPGFLDVVVNKSANVTRIYLPPDVNCLLSVADHCLRSQNYVNVIVCDKQKHLQLMSMDAAITHCTKGIGIWDWASNDEAGEPDVVMASAGDIPTQEALAATDLLRKEFPELKIRFVNVVDLFKLQPASEHPHGLSDREFDSLFTVDKPVIFNFHGYPQLIHRLAYRRTNHDNIHVRGYKEKGSINTPLELAIDNNIDRFSLAMDVVDRVPKLQKIGGHAKERFLNQQIECRNYAHKYGIDKPEATDWTWPY